MVRISTKHSRCFLVYPSGAGSPAPQQLQFLSQQLHILEHVWTKQKHTPQMHEMIAMIIPEEFKEWVE